MQHPIEQELSRLGRYTACIVIRLEEAGPQEIVTLNANALFPAASLAKVPILLEVARQVEQGLLAWNTRYSVPDAAHTSSSGVLTNLSSTLQPTLHDLAHLMIAISDNTAANMLLSLVGMNAVNATMQQLGLTSTHLERRFMDFAARMQGHDNWTTAGDMALLLSYLCTDVLPEREEVLSMLLCQNDNTLLPGYWGETFPFAHKTGALEGILHDAGILYPPHLRLNSPISSHAPYILVVMTAEQIDEPLTRYTLARVGSIILSQA